MEYTVIDHLYRNYSRHIADYLVMLPLTSILYLHYKLYTKHEFFKTGDTVTTTADRENIPAGSIGAIIKKHSSGFVDVEFLDDNGNLLNVLSISADKITHTAVPNLETRVENFGSPNPINHA